jgi:CubicO group peptidase (beta-lactamase class C family)
MSQPSFSRAAIAAVVGALLAAPASRIGLAQDASPFAGFDSFVEGVMKEWFVPGLAVGAVKDGGVVLAKGYGYRDIGKQLPVTSRTVMPIGSNTKSFTATIMGMLSDEKRLDWDKPIRTYLPDFELHDEVATRLITPLDLVTHRSGLPRHDAVWEDASLSRQDIYERLRYLEPTATFRQRYQYNNIIFMTAGYLVERITKQSWDDLVKQRIFTPIGMTSSNTSVRDIPKSADYSQPYVIQEKTVVAVPFRNMDAMAPAGGINSNVEDMLKYVQMHIAQGRAGTAQIVSRAFSSTMQSVQTAAAPENDSGAPVYAEFGPGGYGLGVSVRSYRGRKVVEHTGAIDGFSSWMSWMPNDRVGVVVLTNQSGGFNPVPQIVLWNVYERLLGLSLTDHVARSRDGQQRFDQQAAERVRRREATRTPDTTPSRPLVNFAGTYEHPAYGKVTIALRDGRLIMSRAQQVGALEHWNYDVFMQTYDLQARVPRRRVSFIPGPGGGIESLTINYDEGPIVFRRLPGSGG